jgi:dihydroorotate dehydrogenase
MYSLLRSLLFCLPPETSHNVSLDSLALLAKLGIYPFADKPPALPTTLMGLALPNPVGIAAGLDKNGDYIDALAGLGFGYIEIGTVTPKAQPGNPKPRMFRLASKQAIINRMGFNNHGIDYLLAQVDKAKFDGVLGINIGKNKDTSAEDAVNDYLICLRKSYSRASYITVNLSSPNTPGLRDLQFGKPLKDLLSTLKAEQTKLSAVHNKYVPLAIKIAPDMAIDDVENVAQCLLDTGMDGVIATNTTIDKTSVAGLQHGDEAGGLSGLPVFESSNKVIAALAQYLAGRIPIIGVGGIMSGEDAVAKNKAGAAAVQIYTGFIYQGPTLVGDVGRALKRNQQQHN